MITPNYQLPYQMPMYQTTQIPQQTTQNPTNGIQWVQGEAGARAYPVAAGNSLLLLDSEAPVFYIKSTDASGMPSPLRVFDFTERTQAQQTTPVSVMQENDFATKNDIRQLRESIDDLERRMSQNHLRRKERNNESANEHTDRKQ